MKNTAYEYVKDRFKERIDSNERKRKRSIWLLNGLKFFKIIFGLSSIFLIALSGKQQFADQLRSFFTLFALTTTTLATLCEELLFAFGYRERYASIVGQTGKIKNLFSEMEVQFKLHKLSYPDDDFDPTEYNNKLNGILDSGHKVWVSNQNKDKK